MANTYFPNQFQYTKERMVTELYATVTFGSTGAPTLSNSLGIASIARNSAGRYTITLAQNYNRLLGCDLQIQATAAPAAPFVRQVSEAVATLAAPTLVIAYLAVDNTTATDPASGEKLRVVITLCNSSVSI